MEFKNISIDDIDLVFFDLETTGLNPERGDAICEIGAIKVKDKHLVDTFHTLINPRREIPLEAHLIHRITDEDVKNAPFFEQVIDKFMYFLGTSLVCGYNIGFDLGFLNCELKKINYPVIELASLDILVMAKRTIPGLPRYNLISLAKYFDIEVSHFHRALEDAQATQGIFFKMKDTLKDRGITKVQDFITLYGLSNDFFKKTQEPKISLIKESILAEVILQIRYLSYSNRLNTFVIIPKELTEFKGATFLVGVSTKTKDTLRLNLTRVLDVEIL